MKMSKKEKIAYMLVAIISLIVTFSFLHFFAFEKDNEDKKSLEVSEELVLKLYDFIPDYRLDYDKLANLSSSEIGRITYNYILKYENKLLENANITSDEDNAKIIYQIKEEAWLDTIQKLFGKDSSFNAKEINFQDLKIKYVEDQNLYLVYQKENIELPNYEEKREYQKYEVTDNGEKIIIYDKYIKCDLTEEVCYNDAENRSVNSYKFITNGQVDLKNNLKQAKSYKHTFIYQDGHYIWESSELDD